MTMIQIVEGVAAIILSIGALVATLGYAYGKFKEGQSKVTREGVEQESALIGNLRSQISAFEKLVDDLKKDNNELGRRFTALEATMQEKENSFRALMDEKDKTIKQYLDILKDRNPETEIFMKKMTEEAEASAKHRTIELKIMQEILMHMQKMNSDIKIEATVSKQ